MSFFGKWNSVGLAAVLLAAGSGCSPMDSGSMDEEKEPHFVLGKSRVSAMNYPGAIEAFEASLEANPHSAQAHYQLAMLFENQESDPAAAIYHYQQYLKFDPKAGNADIIAQRIAGCKQQLATDVLQLPSAPAAQQQLEKLAEENHRLHDQLAQWQAYYLAQQAAAKTNPPAPRYSAPTQAGYSLPTQPASLAPEAGTPQSAATPLTGANGATAGGVSPVSNPGSSKLPPVKTCTVTRGDTLASIARKQGVSLAALEEANPSVNPRKLKAGQVLNLPPP